MLAQRICGFAVWKHFKIENNKINVDKPLKKILCKMRKYIEKRRQHWTLAAYVCTRPELSADYSHSPQETPYIKSKQAARNVLRSDWIESKGRAELTKHCKPLSSKVYLFIDKLYISCPRYPLCLNFIYKTR